MSANLSQRVRAATTWSIVLGVLLMLAGAVVIVLPLFTSVAVVFVLGWVFLVSGIFRAVQAIQNRLLGGLGLKLTIAIIHAIAGFLILTNLAVNTISLALLIGLAILVEGMLEIILAFQLRPANNWSWTLLSGLVSIIIGMLICSQQAAGVVWVIGLMVGISLISTGIWFIMLSLAVREASD